MTIEKLNGISFSGKMANAYLEKKAAKKAKLVEETIKENARMLIKQNREAAKEHKYIPSSVYLGELRSTDFAVGIKARTQAAANEYAANAKAIEQAIQPKEIVSDAHFFG